RDLKSSHFEGRGKHKESAAATFNIFFNRIDLRLLIIACRSAHDEHCAGAGHFRLLQKIHALRLIVVARKRVFQTGEAFTVAVSYLVLAAARHKADGPGSALQIADESASDAFF